MARKVKDLRILTIPVLLLFFLGQICFVADACQKEETKKIGKEKVFDGKSCKLFVLECCKEKKKEKKNIDAVCNKSGMGNETGKFAVKVSAEINQQTGEIGQPAGEPVEKKHGNNKHNNKVAEEKKGNPMIPLMGTQSDSHGRRNKERLRIITLQDFFNDSNVLIQSPRDSVNIGQPVNLSFFTNLTREQAASMGLRLEWIVTGDGIESFIRFTGNDTKIRFNNAGNFSIGLVASNRFGQSRILEKKIVVIANHPEVVLGNMPVEKATPPAKENKSANPPCWRWWPFVGMRLLELGSP